jgi:hypothetical protein
MVCTSARARHEPDALAEHLLEILDRQPFEQRDPGLQGGHEIELAVHRPPRDRADLRLDAQMIGQLVDALGGDHGPVHVAHQQALAPPWRGHDRDIVGRIAQRRLDQRTDRSAIAGVDRQLAGCVLGEPARRAAERPPQGGYRSVVKRRPRRVGDQAYHVRHGADCPRTALAMQAAVP